MSSPSGSSVTAPVSAATVPFAMTVAGAPANGVERAISARVEAQLAELMADLRLAGRPEISIAAAEPQADAPAAPAISLMVDGRRGRFPASAISQALAYRDGATTVAPQAPSNLAGLPWAQDAEGVAEVLATVCREAVFRTPELLSGGVQEDVDGADDAAAMQAVLELGMALPDRETLRDAGSVESLIAAAAARSIDAHVDPDHLRQITGDAEAPEVFPLLREGLFVELGLLLPSFRLVPDASLRPRGFAFRINGVRSVPQIGLAPGTILVNDVAATLQAKDVAADVTRNPGSGQPASIVAAEHKDRLEEEELTTWTPLGYFVLSFAAALRTTAHRFVTNGVADELLDRLSVVYPVLAESARKRIPLEFLTAALRELLRERVPITHLHRIVELLLRYETDASSQTVDRMTFLRSGLTDVIAAKVSRRTDTVVAYLLDREIEEAVAEGQDSSSSPTVDDVLADRIAAAVRGELALLPPTAQVPVVLTRSAVRRSICAVLASEFPSMMVVGYSDLPPRVNVQPIARIAFA